MTMTEKRQRLCKHMAAMYNVNDLAEMLIELYEDEVVEDCLEIYED